MGLYDISIKLKCADDWCLTTIVSLLIGPIGSTICNSLCKIAKIKTREMSEPNSRKYLPAKISTYTVLSLYRRMHFLKLYISFPDFRKFYEHLYLHSKY